MKKKVLSSILCAALALSMLAGCGSQSETPADSGSSAGGSAPAPAVSGEVNFLDDASGITDGHFLENWEDANGDYKIANITRTLLNAHWVKNSDGFEAAGKQYGVQADVFAVEAESDTTQQLDYLETCIQKGYDAVIVSPITEDNLLTGLKKATEAGIKIINVDTAEISDEVADKNGIEISCFLGSDNVDCGRKGAEFIADALGDGAKVALIEGAAGDTCSMARCEGFNEGAKAGGLDVVASQTGNWDRMAALDAVTGILRANPDVAGIYCCNDTMVLGAMQAANDLGYEILTSDNIDRAGEEKTLVLIGNDGVPEALEAVQNGTLTGTVAQKPYLMGYSAVEAAIIAINGGTVEDFSTPIALIDKAYYGN